MQPDLRNYHIIVVNSSGGKDSQTALHYVVGECKRLGVDPRRIVVSHQDLGESEWEGTKELAQEQAEHYGLRFIVSRRRDKNGHEETLLEYVRRRGKWPDNKNRFCTSDFKRGPGARVITMLCNEFKAIHTIKPRVLQVFGFRAAESPARAKRVTFENNKRLSNGVRQVDDWLPIHDWSDDQVWESIRKSGVRHHEAYDKGMPRLSCSFCIFAPKGALMIAGRERPEMLQKYIDVEQEIGHTFRKDLSLYSIGEAIKRGEQAETVCGAWNM